MFGAGDGLGAGEAVARGEWSPAPPSAAAPGMREERGARGPPRAGILSPLS